MGNRVCRFLETPELLFSQVEQRGTQHQGTMESIRKVIAGLERQVRQQRDYQQRDFDEFIKGNAGEDTYQRTVAGYRAQIIWLDEEMSRQRTDLDKTERLLFNVEAVEALYPLLHEKLESAAWDDKRFVLECLQARVVVQGQETILELAVPDQVIGAAPTTLRGGCARR